MSDGVTIGDRTVGAGNPVFSALHAYSVSSMSLRSKILICADPASSEVLILSTLRKVRYGAGFADRCATASRATTAYRSSVTVLPQSAASADSG